MVLVALGCILVGNESRIDVCSFIFEVGFGFLNENSVTVLEHPYWLYPYWALFEWKAIWESKTIVGIIECIFSISHL